MQILVPVSVGELVDKITILEIKLAEIKDEAKLKNVQYEYDLLMEVYKKEVPQSSELDRLHKELYVSNRKEWDHENDVRAHWNDDAIFLKGARDTHYQNDIRARLKREINDLMGSSIVEEKSHPKYEHKV